MPTSKRKEHAQEVEFVSIYNKRLRKSFLMSRNVYKQPAQPYNVLHSKLRSGTCSNDSLLPQTPHSKAEQTLPFTFNADGDPECILDSDAQWIPHKKKQGKVRTPSCSPYAKYLKMYTFRLRMNSLRIGFLRTTYLREILELEAPPPSKICQVCNQNNFKFRCRDCFYQPATCSSCCTKSHINIPFHSIDVWNGVCFLPSDLLHVGLAIHLGHQGSPCPEFREEGEKDQWEQDTRNKPNPDRPGASLLLVVHSNGVCRRSIYYCQCSNAPSHHIQLLQHRLFPASYTKPQTVFTFEVLCHFYIEAMECKTSAGAFYSKLKRFTSNAFPDTVPVSILLFSFSLHGIDKLLTLGSIP